MTDPLRSKGLAVVREGRVSIVSARSTPDLQLVEVVARVQSSRDGGPQYAVDLVDGEWRCTCLKGQHGLPCAHLYATQLVTTGVPS